MKTWKGQFDMKTWMWKMWAVAVLSAMTVAAQAALLYDNTTTELVNPTTGATSVLIFPNNQEIGDQIFLANYMTAPYLSGFSFEYYSPNAAFSGTVTADVRFYLNNGPVFNGFSSPGTLFYDTGQFGIQTPQSAVGSDAAVLSFSSADFLGGTVPLNPSMQMPSTLTVSVEFQGLGGSDQVGLPNFGPPTVGYNYGDYWFNNAGTWELLTIPDNITPYDNKVKFAMQLVGVPEPTTFATAALCLGTVLLAGFARRRRQ